MMNEQFDSIFQPFDTFYFYRFESSLVIIALCSFKPSTDSISTNKKSLEKVIDSNVVE